MVILCPDSISARCRKYLGAQGGRWVGSVELAAGAACTVADLAGSLRCAVRSGRVERRGRGRTGVAWRAEPVEVAPARFTLDWPPGWRETVRDALGSP
jgi:hypothetical protein